MAEGITHIICLYGLRMNWIEIIICSFIVTIFFFFSPLLSLYVFLSFLIVYIFFLFADMLICHLQSELNWVFDVIYGFKLKIWENLLLLGGNMMGNWIFESFSQYLSFSISHYSFKFSVIFLKIILKFKLQRVVPLKSDQNNDKALELPII